MTKKIILFLVEGPTDEDALALVYSKLVREHDFIWPKYLNGFACLACCLGERKSVESKYPALFLNLCHIEIDGALVRRV